MHFSTNQLLLYKLFLSYPNRQFYMQEIGHILEKKPGVFQRTLNNIEDDGFVKSEFKANARFFSLNKDYLILKEITSIIKKTSPKMDIFKEKISKLDSKKRKSKSQSGSKKITKKVKKYAAKLSDFQPAEILTSLQIPEIQHPDLTPIDKKPLPGKDNIWTDMHANKKIKKTKKTKTKSNDQLSLF